MSTAGTRTDLGTGDIRVLLIPGSYHFDNVGDVAMCQVAAERIRAVHPGAHMRVLASSDELLEANGLTQATAFHEAPWMIWGKPVSLWLRRERDARRRSLPFRRPRRFLAQAALTRKVSDYAAARGFVQEVLAADLMVICGQGGLHDGSARRAGRLAGMVRLASAAGIPVVASSQGIGPLEDDDLRQVVAEALGEARAVGLREEGSAPVMTAMGIPADRWAVTGDDAIAAALAHAGGEPEDRIGVSLRDNRAASIPSDLPAVVGRAIVAARPGVPVELVAIEDGYAQIRLSSGETRLVNAKCRATLSKMLCV